MYFSLIDANKEETSFVTVGGTTLNSYAEVGDSMSGLKKKRVSRSGRNLHNLVVVPEDGIAMEILGGVEPKHVPHLTATNSILVHVCLNQIRLPGPVPQELKIQLISRRPCPIFRAHLQHSHAQKSEH